MIAAACFKENEAQLVFVCGLRCQCNRKLCPGVEVKRCIANLPTIASGRPTQLMFIVHSWTSQQVPLKRFDAVGRLAHQLNLDFLEDLINAIEKFLKNILALTLKLMKAVEQMW